MKRYFCPRICQTYSLLIVGWVVCTASFIFISKLLQDPHLVCLKKSTTVESRRACFDDRTIDSGTSFTILFWTKPVTNLTLENDLKCGNCTLTMDRRMISRSDAVVFECMHSEPHGLPDPGTRLPSQIYVWSCRESPWSTKKLHNLSFPSIFNNYFNATMTHRRDSEIDYSYLAQITRFSSKGSGMFLRFHEQNVDKILAKKRYLALFVSAACDHTKGASERYNSIMQMAHAGLDVHVYGNCFKNSYKFPPFRSAEAIEIMSRYKFYFSYENSVECKDYITEKFWENALYSGAVPIVQGPSREDIQAQAPPNSYIFAEDYTQEELIKLLEYLHDHEDEYKKYFEWRKILKRIEKSKFIEKEVNPFYRQFFRNRTFGVCDLCRSLHTGRSKTFRPISSMETFWYGLEREKCLSGERQKHTDKSWKALLNQQITGFPLLEVQPNHVIQKAFSYRKRNL